MEPQTFQSWIFLPTLEIFLANQNMILTCKITGAFLQVHFFFILNNTYVKLFMKLNFTGAFFFHPSLILCFNL